MAFRVESRLGRGRVVDTFDAILEVGDERLNVVIKRSRAEYRAHEGVQLALHEWGQGQATVDHPDVVAILESGQDADGVYVIQERVEGATLARVLSKLRAGSRTLTPHFALMIAERMGNGLAGIHASPAAYHGDFRPAEVLVGYDGGVKVGDQRLVDLLIVAGIDPDAVWPDRDYVPPEAAVGRPADTYALALIVLEMMLGHPVWRTSAMTVQDALGALVDFAPIGQAQPELAQDLSDLLRPCLDPDPVRRPASFENVAPRLTDLINVHSVSRDPQALGRFIEAASPPLMDADAPTRMAAVPEMEAQSARLAAERKAAFEAASVVITPEILAQAEAEYRKRRAEEASAPVAAGRRVSAVSVSNLDNAAEVLAPSALRSVAAELPNVAAKAAESLRVSATTNWLWPAAAALLLISLVTWSLSPSGRTIQLRVTSEPSAASVFVDDELVGQTPLTRPLDVNSDNIELRFEKDGFAPHEVFIGTREDELRYEASLRASP
ncbi:MAG: protein kinase [Myxococcota bacterium]